jgi:hypothetical protein
VREADGIVKFGEWLPDLPTLDNPGLTEAKNVIPTDSVYKPFLPVSGTGDALAARPMGGLSTVDTAGSGFFYAATQTKIYIRSGTGWSSRYGGTFATPTDGYWSGCQFDDLAIFTNYADVPVYSVAGSGTNFATLATTGTAPNARCVGVVGRFVVLGDTDLSAATPNGIQWSAIDDPNNWPTPGSAAAQAAQSGEQFLNAAYGPVTHIVGGEQSGIVFQRNGITRMTYVGGNVVFQFDTIERARGALFPNAVVQFGRLAYFISGDGFYVTDGVEVKPIGSQKVDNYFGDDVDTSYKARVRGAVDYANKCIYWIYPGAGNTGGQPNKVLIYNYEENRWSRAEDDVAFCVSGVTTAISLDDLDDYFSSLDIVTPSLDSDQWAGGNNTILAFDSSYKLGAFSGTTGTAIIDGGEIELTPGRLTRVQGVKPLVTGDDPEMTVALGVRDSLGDSVSYLTARTPNARTGFADYRSESRYHRARVTITGNFTAAIGLEYQAIASGAA